MSSPSKSVIRGSGLVNRKNNFLVSRAHDPRSPIHDSRGFTLVEALVAIVILACGLVVVAEGMGRTQQAFRISQNLTAASILAQEKMADLEMELEQLHKLRSSSDQGKEKAADREYGWAETLRPYKHPSIKDTTKLNQASLVFEWKEGRGRAGKLELSSLLLNKEKKL